MSFISNYWVVLMVLFILILLIVLSYLIDKEIRKMKENDDNYDKDASQDSLEIVNNNEEMIADTQDEVINIELEDKEKVDNSLGKVDSRELDYDELDIPDIDDDFNKVIHKKQLIDSSIKESIDALEITDIDIKEDKKEEEIILPEIKIKKDNLSDVWE